MSIQSVAVIGAGPVGRRLAALFVDAKFAVVLEDILPSNLRKAAEYFVASDLSCGTNPRFASSIEDAVRAVDLIVDSVPDELESKLEIFSLLDRMAPPLAILVTPTQSLSIADLASCTYRSERCVAMHFGSAELLLGGEVTLVSTSRTSPQVMYDLSQFWERVGFRVSQRTDPAEEGVTNGTLF